MNQEGSPSQPKGLKPDVKIITTHPNGKSVQRYRQILEQRAELRRKNKDPQLDVTISKTDPENIIKAVRYAGLQHKEETELEQFLAKHGENSDYALIMNRATGEMALFVDGETHPLRPAKAYEKELARN